MNLTFPFLIHCPQRLAILRDECRGGEDKTNRLHGLKLVRQMLEGRRENPFDATETTASAVRNPAMSSPSRQLTLSIVFGIPPAISSSSVGT